MPATAMALLPPELQVVVAQSLKLAGRGRAARLVNRTWRAAMDAMPVPSAWRDQQLDRLIGRDRPARLEFVLFRRGRFAVHSVVLQGLLACVLSPDAGWEARAARFMARYPRETALTPREARWLFEWSWWRLGRAKWTARTFGIAANYGALEEACAVGNFAVAKWAAEKFPISAASRATALKHTYRFREDYAEIRAWLLEKYDYPDEELELLRAGMERRAAAP